MNDLEDFCGNEYDRGLGRVWICSLPVDNHRIHQAKAWHAIDGQLQAEWSDERLEGYRLSDGTWLVNE